MRWMPLVWSAVDAIPLSSHQTPHQRAFLPPQPSLEMARAIPSVVGASQNGRDVSAVCFGLPLVGVLPQVP